MTEALGRLHREMLAGLADMQTSLLRHTYRAMSRGEDRQAQADIEGLASFHRAVVLRFPALDGGRA